ncbi:4'-phosphopantetheinyl transferase family protein [Cellulomonas shaoxiangyii]|uniref:4'-phosphopantetheinyl transferase family protein n=1 Tax=Cellulomonas shaoxiangyii TaxID=2566013 RepID=UPI001AA0AD90|nr:4'-phosphopantetheinyl transferase superfamily protein [Cellulomonas shaoxiangyii]
MTTGAPTRPAAGAPLCGRLLRAVLPPGAVGADATGDLVDTGGRPVGALRGVERALVLGAVPGRTREVTTARHCARVALAALGAPVAPVPRDVRGAPVWPAGVVGSLTHCRGYRAAVVARSVDLAAVGLDAERLRTLADATRDAVVRPDERGQTAVGVAAAHVPVLLFSAKEAVYKAWCGHGGEPIRLADVRVVLGAGALLATVHARGGGAPTRYRGSWAVQDDLVVTSAVPE